MTRNMLIVNGLTFFRVVAAAWIIVYFYFFGLRIEIVLVTVAAFASDFLDGYLARRWHTVTAFGTYADPLADKLVCLSLLWMLAWLQPGWLTACAIIITLYDVATTLLRLLARKTTQVSVATSKVAKLKTASLMIAILVLLVSLIYGLHVLQIAGTVLLAVSSLLAVISLKDYLSTYWRGVSY